MGGWSPPGLHNLLAFGLPPPLSFRLLGPGRRSWLRGIDYEETFTPVACISSVRTFLAIVAASKWDLFQMDVKNTFFNGDLSEEIYM